MRSGGSLGDWYRFLDADNEDEAAARLLRLSTRLDEICTELAYLTKGLNYSPDGDLEDCLRVSLSSLGEGIDVVNDVLRRVRAGGESRSA